MKQIIIYAFVASLLFLAGVSCSKNKEKSVTSFQSNYPFDETAARLQAVLEAENIRVFAVVDHADEAEKAGLSLRPTKVLIVGNPKVGTPLMQENQQLAIELPLKILIAENEQGEVVVSYKKASALAPDFNLKKTAENIRKIDQKMAEIISNAIN